MLFWIPSKKSVVHLKFTEYDELVVCVCVCVCMCACVCAGVHACVSFCDAHEHLFWALLNGLLLCPCACYENHVSWLSARSQGITLNMTKSHRNLWRLDQLQKGLISVLLCVRKCWRPVWTWQTLKTHKIVNTLISLWGPMSFKETKLAYGWGWISMRIGKWERESVSWWWMFYIVGYF